MSPYGCPQALRAPQRMTCVDLPMPDATLRPNVYLVHKDDEEDTGHVDLLQQPGTRRRARLPP